MNQEERIKNLEKKVDKIIQALLDYSQYKMSPKQSEAYQHSISYLSRDNYLENEMNKIKNE